jgi:hypothetical protein
MSAATPVRLVSSSAHVVLFSAPPVKLTPNALRAAFASIPLFEATLPEVVTPVAALGIAVRAATTDTQRWIHAGQAQGASRWIMTAADVDRTHARIEGYSGVEVRADGALVVDASIPLAVADIVRAAYNTARGVVEPSRLNAALATWCKARGQYLRDGSYMLSSLDVDTQAILDAVIALGGIGAAFAVGGASLQAFAAPVARSLEDDIAAVLASASAVIAKAKAAQKTDGPTIQERTGDTAHRDIDDVKARLTLWRDRLGLAMGEVDAQLTDAATVLDTELDRALAACAARKAARRNGGGGSAPSHTLDARAA